MRRSTAILLLLIFVFTSTEICQLIRVPALITHYREHKSTNDEISFVRYFMLHYFSNEHNEDSRHHHEDLPFHQNHSHAINTSLAVLPATSVSSFCSASANQTLSTIYISQLHKSSDQGAIWQPPKR